MQQAVMHLHATLRLVMPPHVTHQHATLLHVMHPHVTLRHNWRENRSNERGAIKGSPFVILVGSFPP
jgi:hypothetical protein